MREGQGLPPRGSCAHGRRGSSRAFDVQDDRYEILVPDPLANRVERIAIVEQVAVLGQKANGGHAVDIKNSLRTNGATRIEQPDQFPPIHVLSGDILDGSMQPLRGVLISPGVQPAFEGRVRHGPTPAEGFLEYTIMMVTSKQCATMPTSELLVLRGMKKKKATKLSQGQRQRLQFIESRLIWEGYFRRVDICDAFELTLNHVTREITTYRKEFKNNLVYDPETRAWRAGLGFAPAYASDAPEDYLTFLHAFALSGDQAVMATAGPPVPTESLPVVASKIERAVLKEVIGAIRRKSGLAVRYQSFSDPEPVERTLWPHAMAFAHDRWHLRAYDSRRKQFGDFVLARIVKARPAEAEASSFPGSADDDWHTQVKLEIVPTATLSVSQTAAVVRQFGMRRNGDDWVWSVSLRRCLVPYFLQQHRLDLPVSAAPHRRITLRDQTLIKRFSFIDD